MNLKIILTFKKFRGFASMKNDKLAVIFVTLYLFVFTALSRMDVELEIMLSLFSLSPFLIVWMVYTVLKYGKHSGKTLDEREWGYEDKA